MTFCPATVLSLALRVNIRLRTRYYGPGPRTPTLPLCLCLSVPTTNPSNFFSRPLAYNFSNVGKCYIHGSTEPKYVPVPQSYQYLNHRQVQQFQESVDSSGPLFSMYSNMAEGEDVKMAKRWQKDADGVLIFVGTSIIFHIASLIKSILQTGLFSATVSVLLAVTVLDFKPNPQDTSAFYLKNIYQLQVLAHPTIPPPLALNSSTPADQPSSSPSKYVIWVNSLWFSSLIISLSCAMLATLLQQWARRYLRKTRPLRHSPHEQARRRALFADGIYKFHLSVVADALLSLIQLSLFLFFFGLLIYLFNVNHTAFIPAACSILVSVLVYLFITFMPFLRCESPYYTPLSSIIGLCWNMEKAAKKTAQERSEELDNGILEWIFDAVVHDHQLTQFLENILGFCRSSVVKNPLLRVTSLGRERLTIAMMNLLERTWSSNFLPSSDKIQRLVVCVKITDLASLPLPSAVRSILVRIFGWDEYKVLQSIEIGQSLTSRNNYNWNGLCAQCIVAAIISNVQESDDRWIVLAADHLRTSEDLIRGYLAHSRESVLLASLTHITRQILQSALGDHLSRNMADESSYILYYLPNFDIRKALPGLQHDFRDLWEDINRSLREEPNNNVLEIIRYYFLQCHEEALAWPDNSPGSHSSDLASPDEAVDDESMRTLPVTPTSVIDYDATPDSADQSTPGILPHVTQPTVQAALSSHSSPDPLESHDVSRDSQGLASPAAVTPGNIIADTSSRDQSTLQPDPSRSPTDAHAPTDSATTPSHDNRPQLSSPVSTSAPSPAAPHVASNFGPNVASTVSLGPHDDSQDPYVPIDSTMAPPHDNRLESPPPASLSAPSPPAHQASNFGPNVTTTVPLGAHDDDPHAPTDSVMAPSHDNELELSPPTSTYAPSPAAPQVSIFDPNVASSVPLSVRDDSQGPNNPSQMELSHDTPQLGPSGSPA
jgi:hypothetical protein